MLLSKVKSNINLCKVEISFDDSGSTLPYSGNVWQKFYDTLSTSVFYETYTSLVSINYQSEKEETPAGPGYKNKVTFRFPNSDEKRSERIALFEKIKYVKLTQNNGLVLFIGRNDFFQNSPPKIKINDTEQLCTVEITSLSISPVGYMN